MCNATTQGMYDMAHSMKYSYCNKNSNKLFLLQASQCHQWSYFASVDSIFHS